jgi:ACS family hexuronate transporter-like MFS transporter
MASASQSSALSLHLRGNLRWIIIVLIFLATTINYIDRQTISVAAPSIMKEFSLTKQDYSWIVTSFLLAYAMMQVVTGMFIDRIGTKRGFSIAIVWWSIANMLHALGSGVWSFSLLRFLLGVGEAGNYPAALKAIAEWFPKTERSTAVGILNAGPGLGAIIAPPLVAWLIVTMGWRMAFVVTGAIGLIWLIAWQKIYDTPEFHPRLTQQEAELILGERFNNPALRTKTPWRRFFQYKEVWGLMLSRFVCDGAFYFFAFWLPTYLSDVRGFSIQQIGMFAWIPYLAADCGSLLGGWAGTRLIKNGMTVNRSRKVMIWLGAAMVPMAMPAYFVSSPYMALLFIAIAMFAVQIKSSSLFTVPADLVDSQNVATVWGLSGAAGSLGGMLFTPLIGWLVDHVSYQPVFVIVSVMHLVSALIVMILIPRIEPLNPLGRDFGEEELWKDITIR